MGAERCSARGEPDDGQLAGFKIAIGAVAAFVLFRWGNRPLARYGLAIALAVYLRLMGIHIFTGLAAFGYVSNTLIHEWAEFSGQFLAIIF